MDFLVEAGKNPRDEQAFSRLLQDLNPTLRSWITKKLRKINSSLKNEDILDIYQETLFQLVDNPPSDRDLNSSAEARLHSWINTVCKNLVISLMRTKNWRSTVVLDDFSGVVAPEEPPDSLANLMQAFPSADTIHEDLSTRMTEKLFRYFMLTQENPEMSAGELADKLQVSLDNLYQMKCRVRKVLLQYLRDKGF